jgi:uncharacterized protein YbbK (DUF523 family)
MAEIITQKVPLGVSACIFGCPVRYNGKGRDEINVLGREKTDFVFTPVCPECAAGLGVPRMPIHLTGPGQEVIEGKARVKNRRGHEVTDDLLAGCEASIETLERAGVRAFIAKEASPSCGVYKARVGKKRQEQLEGSGVFGAMLLERGWFIIPDKALANPLLWWDWRRRLHAWMWLSDRDVSTARDLYDVWHVLKFVVQETDRPFADEMGRRLAALPKRPPRSDIDAAKADILGALRKPSTRSRIRQSMWKTYVHAKKRGRLDGVDLHDLKVDSPEVQANINTIVKELTGLERISFENDELFGTSPVIRRDGKRVKARDESATSKEG